MGKLSPINPGDKFGRLTVIARVEDAVNKSDGKHSSRFLCQCSCPEKNTIVVRGKNLINNQTRSCGCIRKETASMLKSKTPKDPNIEYNPVYGNMKVVGAYHTMMYDARLSSIPMYGEWAYSSSNNCIKNFYDAMSPSYENGYKIGRINPQIGFRPSNCYWADGSKGNLAQLNNKFIEFEGTMFTASEWNRAMGYPPNTVRDRIAAGYSDLDAIFGKEEDKVNYPSNAIYFVDNNGRPLNKEATKEYENE